MPVELYEFEVPVFDIYFASLMSMNMHPGTTRDPPSKLSMDEVAIQALQMIEVRRKVMAHIYE